METHWLEQTEADLPAHDDWLSADEAVLLSHLRFAKRRADWRLGRWTAKRAAAAYLNLPGDPRSLREIEVRPAPSGRTPGLCPQPIRGDHYFYQPSRRCRGLCHRDGWRAARL